MKDDDKLLSNSEETIMPLPQPLPPPPMNDPELLERMQAAAREGSECTTCAFCGQKFPTRSSMFRHLERPSDVCSAPRKDMGEKVFLIVGYDCCLMGARTENGAAAAIGGEGAATAVLRAMGIEVGKKGGGGGAGGGDEDADDHPPGCSRPGGFSQASSVGSRTCPLLAQEAKVSATADTICVKAPTTVPIEGIRAWLDEVNATLDRMFDGRAAVRVLGRMMVPPSFHAEIHAKRRRYEYLIPAYFLDETAQEPWAGGARGQESLIPLLRRLRGRGLKPFGHCSGDHSGKRRRCPLWHNFSAHALPHSPSSLRRLYRFFAMEVIQSPPPGAGAGAGASGGDFVCLSINGDAFMSQQVRGMVALAIAGARGLVSGDDIAACIDPTRQEDMLPVPLAPATPSWLAEVGYSAWQMRLGVGGGGLCMSPGAEQRACLPLEGWSDEASRSEAAEFRRGILQSAARWWEERQCGAAWLRDVLVPGALKLRRELDASSGRAGAGVAPEGEADVEVDGEGGGAGGSRGEDEGSGQGAGDGATSNNSSRGSGDVAACRLSAEDIASLDEAPIVYAEVLRLLREADASGSWPYSSASRSLVILGDDGPDAGVGTTRAEGGEEEYDTGGTGVEAEASAAARVSAADREGERAAPRNDQEPAQQQQQQQQQQQRVGAGGSGSFTLGTFPPPCPPPRGNRLFPALARAAFELEAALLPDRPQSTTIAVNRNAQFKPHVDSGAGAGQSRSLIVGLGDYKRGELVVEGEEMDIRYRPLEFNGWTQRHWTRPFIGERYSLVWFTPKGCEGITGDARFVADASADQ